LGALACIVDVDDADILAGDVNELNLGIVDALVDAGAAPVRGKLDGPSCDVSVS